MLVILIDALDLNEYPSPQHPHDSVQDDPKLLDDGGSIPDCEISSTWQKTCQTVNCLVCFVS